MSPKTKSQAKLQRRKRMKALTRAYLFLLGFSFLFLLFAPRIVKFVEAGEGGVLFRRFFGGVVTTEIYGEGVHFIFPWNNMTNYNVRIQEESLEFAVLSANGLTINIDLSVRYHPEYDTLGLLHKRVGPDYAQKLIVPIVEGAVRKTAGNYAAEEFYSSHGPILEEIDNQVRAELAQYFIFLDGLTIKRIQLPRLIESAIEQKEEQREKLLAYQYRLRSEKEEAIRKQIEAVGWSNFNKMVGSSISPRLLQWRGIEATLQLATSTNSKVVIVGNGSDGMPVILGSDYTSGGGASPQDAGTAMTQGTETFSGLDTRIKQMRSLFDALIKRNTVDETSDLGTVGRRPNALTDYNTDVGSAMRDRTTRETGSL